MNSSNVGNLMCLYMDEIIPVKGTDASEFVIKASAKVLMKTDGRNWVPVIVKEVAEDQYEIIGNEFIYAIAEEAGLERVWCIIADSSHRTLELTRVLTGELTPKINLSVATRDEIQSALQYLIEKPGSVLKGVKLAVATNHINNAPRKYWKTLDPITKLKCGITKGKKLNALNELFYLTPQEFESSSEEYSANTLNVFTVIQLKNMAKKQGLSGYSKKKKQELIEMLVSS